MESSRSQTDRILEILNPHLEALGYEIVHAEVNLSQRKTLRLFIDLKQSVPGQAIGIEDCVKANHALEAPLENNAEIDGLFKGPYELEISSPGIDRPLRSEKDYAKFAGNDVRVHTFRPLTAAEIENDDYQSKNPKQKNFLGVLEGLENQKILLKVDFGKIKTQIRVPLQWVSKANLEPKLDLKELAKAKK